MSVEIINGSRTSFGPRSVETDTPWSVHVAGVRNQLVLKVDYSDLPSHINNDATGASIPSGAVITNVQVLPASTTFAGGTSYDIDLVELDGTAVATVDTVTLAQMNAGETLQVEDLASAVNTTTDGAPAYVTFSETGTFTAGEGTVVIEYVLVPA